MRMKVVAAVLAAGRGTRLGTDKALLDLNGQAVWKWSYDAFRNHPLVSSVGLVCSRGNLESIRSKIEDAEFVVLGGETRQDSSRIAVEAMPPDTEIALVHDAARPFVGGSLIGDVILAACEHGASAPAIPVADTIRERHGDGSRNLNRDQLLAMQTPQAARYELLKAAHERVNEPLPDEVSLVEALGVRPHLVNGDPANFKLTYPGDLLRSGALVPGSEVRMGIGYDVHAWSDEPGRPLMLGGVPFPGEQGLAGHSDADPLLHAIVDALLGAAGLGDIGVHFPNTEPRWKNEPSSTFLRFAAETLQESGWAPVNLDATVIAERPRIARRTQEMRTRISEALGLDPAVVNVKATTNEGIAFIGEGKGIASFAVATIRRISL
jgi:2-C-methyl-D-erythritol 4-phosphate cytidylyltransferase/2-C-methyl-D-erythritol 2,4-cyclodiphosphate synthase